MRYIQLSFLLLTLPLVWAVWPFPQFSSKFSQWWEKFWKQAFFPVPLVFCLWLGLMIAQKLSTIGVGKNPLGAFNSVATNSNTGEAAAAITSALGGFIGPLADNLFRAILVGGIMVAGLMVADSMGATFAGTAMNALKAGQNKVKNNLTTRIQRGAKTAGKAVQQRTLGLQKMAVTLQGKTIGKLSEANERAGLAVQNLTLRPRGLEKTRVKVKMSGELRDDKGKLMDDGQGHLLVPVWDDHAHDWKKNEAGEVFDKTTGGFVKGKVKVTSVDMTDKNGAITNLDVKDATQYGLVVDNKPVSQYAYLTKNQAGAVTDVRGTTSLTAERLEHTLHAYEIKPGDILSGKEQAIRKARGELVQEAEKSPGIIHGIVVNPIGETARVFAGIASSEKGRKETKKPGDKKPEKKEPEHH